MNRPGYTTTESIMVISTIAILSVVIVIAVTADKRLVDTRNTERRTEVATIISGITRYAIDHDGKIPETITHDLQEICRPEAGSCEGKVDLTSLVESGTYLEPVPIDPHAEGTGTGYWINRVGTYRIHVEAPLAEWGVTISKSL